MEAIFFEDSCGGYGGGEEGKKGHFFSAQIFGFCSGSLLSKCFFCVLFVSFGFFWFAKLENGRVFVTAFTFLNLYSLQHICKHYT